MLVSQPVLVLLLALALGLLAAAAVASSALARTRKRRASWVIAFAAASVVAGCATAASGLRFNFTPSMPLGIYRLAPVSKSELQRGMFVVVCAPFDAAELGRRRGYLAAGPCPADTELLLKAVAAVAGDVVAVLPNGVAVNGCPLPHSRPLSFDAAGRRLLPWPGGRYKLRRGQLWVYADNDRSWDSRFWGPVLAAAVVSRALQVLTIAPMLRSAGGERGCGMATRPAPHLRRQEIGI